MNGREVIGQTRFIAVVANDCAADDHASSFSDHDELIVGVEVMPVDLLRDLLCGEIGKQNVPSFMLLRRQARDVVLLGRTGVPGKVCTREHETNWYERSLGWHEGRSTVRSRS